MLLSKKVQGLTFRGGGDPLNSRKSHPSVLQPRKRKYLHPIMFLQRTWRGAVLKDNE